MTGDARHEATVKMTKKFSILVFNHSAGDLLKTMVWVRNITRRVATRPWV